MNNLKIFDNLIFDFDGVLVDSVKNKEEIYCNCFGKLNSRKRYFISNYVRNNSSMNRIKKLDNIFSLLITNFPKKEIDIQYKKNFKKMMTENIKNTIITKDVLRFLNYFSDKYLYIVSSGPKDEIEFILKKNLVYEKFASIYGGIDNKSIILKKLKMTYPHKKMIFIGDKISDLNSAKDSDMEFIGKISSFNPTNFPDNINIFKDFSELLNND